MIRELEAAKRFANKRESYIKSLKEYLTLFVRGREQQSIQLFDVSAIETWFNSREEALSTRASNIGRLSSLFSFAVRRGYIAENPCDKLERITVERSTPAIWTPDQIRDALHFTTDRIPRFMLWLVLASIVGIRPGELDHMTRADVIKHARNGLLIVDGGSKIRGHRRIIRLSDHALIWIAFASTLPSELPLPESAIRRYRRKLKDTLQLPWPQDIPRHTALSHLVAYYQDEGRVAMESGNSVKILRKHYLGLVTPAENQRFQNNLPRGWKFGRQLWLGLE